MYQKRYLYLKDDILYYSHNEFNPNVSIRKCNPIPLSSDMVFDYPSTIQDPQIQNNKSIDLHFENRVYTFVSDPQFPNSADFIFTVAIPVFFLFIDLCNIKSNERMHHSTRWSCGTQPHVFIVVLAWFIGILILSIWLVFQKFDGKQWLKQKMMKENGFSLWAIVREW